MDSNFALSRHARLWPCDLIISLDRLLWQSWTEWNKQNGKVMRSRGLISKCDGSSVAIFPLFDHGNEAQPRCYRTWTSTHELLQSIYRRSIYLNIILIRYVNVQLQILKACSHLQMVIAWTSFKVFAFCSQLGPWTHHQDEYCQHIRPSTFG